MNKKPYFQNKLPISPNFGYSSQFSKTQKNNNIFKMKGLANKNRDISPFRKYKQIHNKNIQNNIIKNNQGQTKNLKIEGDLITGMNSGVKKTKTPINNNIKKNITNKSPNMKNNLNLNSLSISNSININKPKFKPIQKSTSKSKITKPTNSYYSPLNRSIKMNINRSITPNNKNKLIKSNNYNMNKPMKFNRSITPVPKSKFSLHKNSSKIGFGNNFLKNKKTNQNSPFLGMKNKNYLSSNKFNTKGGLNLHYNNIFKSKNIFSIPGGYKNKPKVITINMNINQNFLSTSSKNNLSNNNNNINKASPRTPPLSENNNNTTNNITDNNINNNSNNTNNNSINMNNINVNNNINNNISTNNNSINMNNINNNSSFNILHNFNDTQIQSNNSIIITGTQINNNNDNKQQNINNNDNLPKQIRKKILCMHEFSKTGYAGEDEKKVNQDNYFVFRNFVNDVNYIFMAVCDGHGAVGQEISNFLKENLPIDLNHALKDKKIDILKDDISEIIKDIFIKENTKLISNEMINSMLSGSTCVSVIYTPIKLITANVGDSRIILGRYNKENNKYKSVDLTRDHKPCLPDEEKRILNKGGRIEPMKDEDNSFIGPPRVWLKEQDYPGLAMSRSFGDRVAHSVGVSEEPEIKEYPFREEDKFFVVASDGLFEFISSQDIVDIIKDYYLSGDIVGCCEYLYDLSRDKWMKEEEVVDDITMILVFLEDEKI